MDQCSILLKKTDRQIFFRTCIPDHLLPLSAPVAMPPMNNQERKQLHIRIILGLTLACAAALFFVPPIPQPLEYHHFADSRTLLWIPNFSNLISSLLFLPTAAYGLKLLFDPRNGAKRAHFQSNSEAIPYAAFFVAAALTCFGSAYYHFSPDNASLVWDRLPMTMAFASLLSIVISERINRRAGLILLPFLVLLGFFSVWQWYQSELAGAGDLRLYLMIQFFPFLLIFYMLFFLRTQYSRGNRFGWVLVLYALAKATELFDQQIFDQLIWVSGHTIKHILAALAIFTLAEMLRCRIPINRVQKAVSELDNY